uniref:Uncharacterized protein n=1 Tax=Aegilops tauschii TaxID=37682 RepID=M8B432_AEGTA
MAGDAAPEIKPEQVVAAIGDRTKKMDLLATQFAAGPHPIPEERLTRLRNLQAAISAELDDLAVVLDGVSRGDLTFMEQIPPARLDKLLGARTDRVARLRGVPLERRLDAESCALAFAVALGKPMPAFSARAVTAASDAPPSASGQAAAAAASKDLARLQI